MKLPRKVKVGPFDYRIEVMAARAARRERRTGTTEHGPRRRVAKHSRDHALRQHRDRAGRFSSRRNRHRRGGG